MSADETLYRDLPVEVALGPKSSREVFVNSKEQKLASYFFPSKGTTKALVVLAHGHGCSLQHEYLYHKVRFNRLDVTCNFVGFMLAGTVLHQCKSLCY